MLYVLVYQCNCIQNHKSSKYHLNLLIYSAVQDRLKYLCDGNVRGGGFASQYMSLESILLDLSEYECDDIVKASLDLLTQMYFFEEELYNMAQKVELILLATIQFW